MDAKRIGEAGLVGMRGKLGRRVSEWIGARTRLDPRTLRAAAGAVILLATVRRVVEIVRRLRRAA